MVTVSQHDLFSELDNSNMVSYQSTDEHFSKPVGYGFGSKTINCCGGVVMIINFLVMPSLSRLPYITQQGGWLWSIALQVLMAGFSFACGFLMLSAIRSIPGNQGYALRIEFTDLATFYLTPWMSRMVQGCYLVSITLLGVNIYVRTAQVLDFASADLFGCTSGIELWPRFGRAVCANGSGETPFGEDVDFVLTLSILVMALLPLPFVFRTLADSIVLQWVSMFMIVSMIGVLLSSFIRQSAWEASLAATGDPIDCFGELLNFRVASLVPSWANERRPEVNIVHSFAASLTFTLLLSGVFSILGALSFPKLESRGCFLSVVYASHDNLEKIGVTLLAIVNYLSAIPILTIFVKYNLRRLGLLGNVSASFLSFIILWFLSIFFYGRMSGDVCVWGMRILSIIVNFIVPVLLYFLSTKNRDDFDGVSAHGT